MSIQSIILSACAAIATLGILLFLYKKARKEQLLTRAHQDIEQRVVQKKKEADRLVSSAYEDSKRIKNQSRNEIDKEIKSRRAAIVQIENHAMEKEKHLDSRDDLLAEKENNLEREKDKIKQLKEKQEEIIQNLLSTLEKAAGFSREEAKKILLDNVERDVRQRAGNMIKEMEAQAKKIANRKAKEIIVDAIQRTAVDHIVSATTSSVQLPDDELKGRIIGREGRNIRAFESMTGVDVIIDDSPGTVILSAFDPIRREIAKLSLEKLVQDGRINPSRIEEAVERSRSELAETVKERGEEAADELGLQFHPKIIEMMGKLHYRTSYGQNMLSHSLECAHVAAIIAEELNVNATLAKRGAMLHDIGKAIDFEQGGSHTTLGKEVCEKHGESAEILNCIMAHHEEEPFETIEAVIVKMADVISSSRPGARRESVEAYVKRLEKLETLAYSFEGIDRVFAIQAGREVRVIVKPDEVDEPSSHKLANDIAVRIEKEMEYPGEVKVSIIRETRATGVAR
ncbi:ribonuclease Y [bacterium]|jgi:ribonucrease Y|nr:ribonuclease Y [bacterium]